MVRPFTIFAVVALAALAGCGQGIGDFKMPFSRSRPAVPESAVAPDCRSYCERSMKVCMDKAAVPRQAIEEDRGGRLFGPADACGEQMRGCYATCQPAK